MAFAQCFLGAALSCRETTFICAIFTAEITQSLELLSKHDWPWSFQNRFYFSSLHEAKTLALAHPLTASKGEPNHMAARGDPPFVFRPRK
jgi:hypothetical protein